MTRLSIVIPAYNNSHYIEATLRSVLSQDFDDFEVIVADHSSSDGTREIVERFADDERLTILSTPAGGGAARNWARVTDVAKGELIKLVCGDDLIYPSALREQVLAFTDESIVLVASSRDVVDASGRHLLSGRGLRGLRGRVSGTTAIRATVRAGSNLFGEPACVMMRREALVAAGGWDGRFPYLIDEATYAAVLRRGDMVGLARPLAAFRVNDGQWSVALAREQSRQACEFHRFVRTTYPDAASRFDVVLGNARARVNALLRRLVYAAFAARLRAPTASVAVTPE